jgi:hypothetical protein
MLGPLLERARNIQTLGRPLRAAPTTTFSHPHPLNHVRFRALSCILRGAGFNLPPAYRQAGIEGEGIHFKGWEDLAFCFLRLAPHAYRLTSITLWQVQVELSPHGNG